MEKEINNGLEKTLNYLQEEIIPYLKRQLDEKQKRIDKAVEYINTFSITVNVPIYRQILDIDPKELLDILKGDE